MKEFNHGLLNGYPLYARDRCHPFRSAAGRKRFGAADLVVVVRHSGQAVLEMIIAQRTRRGINGRKQNRF